MHAQNYHCHKQTGIDKIYVNVLMLRPSFDMFRLNITWFIAISPPALSFSTGLVETPLMRMLFRPVIGVQSCPPS